ncbi:hypothetical protein [Bartonella tribocorum]|uniref:Uncharacterized protein n=1 Tax=Bartonella tribocorum TaxID=85701 RepID=A0A2M6URV3_9HYPH|nr:hypothetical protein [Bartonella tribocorum]PIT68912.1 hypothetical protein CER18_05050 [Bartonella tribocorum]
MGKHYPIAELMQLDQLDPIVPLRNRDKLSPLLSPTQSANIARWSQKALQPIKGAGCTFDLPFPSHKISL